VANRYSYRAKRGPREVVQGVLEGESYEAVVRRLTEQGFVPIQITPLQAEAAAPPTPAPRSALLPHRIRGTEITLFTRELASLFRSNVPVLKSLDLIAEQWERPGFKEVARRMVERVKGGESLSQVFGRFPALFSPLYQNLVRAGEVSGKMDEMLYRLVEYREQQEAFQAKVEMAFVYPLFLLGTGVATILALVIVVVPRLGVLFADLKGNLPWPTMAVLAVSDFMSRTWWMWALPVIAGWALFARRSGPGQAVLDRLQMVTPFWKGLTRKVEAARFCRTLGILLDTGIPVLQAVASAVSTVENQVVRLSFGRVEGMLASGSSLSRCLRQVPAFSPMAVGIIAIGEESGDLPRKLAEIAVALEIEVERAMRTVTTLLEPALILALAVIIGVIVSAVFLPIFEIGSGIVGD